MDGKYFNSKLAWVLLIISTIGVVFIGGRLSLLCLLLAVGYLFCAQMFNVREASRLNDERREGFKEWLGDVPEGFLGNALDSMNDPRVLELMNGGTHEDLKEFLKECPEAVELVCEIYGMDFEELWARISS